MREANQAQIYYRRGVLPVMSASTLWALAYFFRKGILIEVPALLLTFFTAVIAATSLAIWSRFRIRELWRELSSHAALYFGYAFFGVALGTSLMFYGLQDLDLGVALTLEKLQPVFTLLLAKFLLDEEIPMHKMPWIVAALISSYFVSLPEPWSLTYTTAGLMSVAAVVGAALCWSISTILGKKLMLHDGNAVRVTLLRFFIGAIFLLPFLIFRQDLGLHLTYSTHALSVIFLSAVICTAGGYVLYCNGLRYLGASTAAFLEMLTPVIGISLGFLLLDETMTLSQMFAGLLLLVSVGFVVRQ